MAIVALSRVPENKQVGRCFGHDREMAPGGGTQVLRVEADDLRAVDWVSAGDVAVAVGLTHAATGDTLVAASGALRGLQLHGVSIPPPVFSIAVEAESFGQQVGVTGSVARAGAPRVEERFARVRDTVVSSFALRASRSVSSAAMPSQRNLSRRCDGRGSAP